MARKVISILCYVVAGFFLYAVLVTQFITSPTTALKLGISAVFLIPALVFLVGGLLCSLKHRWNRDVGIVLLSSAGFTAFIVLSMACILMDPEIKKAMPPRTTAFLKDVDYLSGALSIALMGALGAVLMFAARNPTALHVDQHE